MSKKQTFTRLAQANVDHYINHPVAHGILTAGAAVLAYSAIVVLPRKMAENDLKRKGVNPHL